jgi:hypothetical protein
LELPREIESIEPVKIELDAEQPHSDDFQLLLERAVSLYVPDQLLLSPATPMKFWRKTIFTLLLLLWSFIRGEMPSLPHPICALPQVANERLLARILVAFVTPIGEKEGGRCFFFHEKEKMAREP